MGTARNVTAGHASTPLHSVAERGRVDLLREFLAQPGVNVNAKNRLLGSTALHVAAMNKNPECPEYAALLEAGADPLVHDNKGRTPLVVLSQHPPNLAYAGHIASRNRIAALLVAAGDRRWHCLPWPCPGLEIALLPVWKQAPQELGHLFHRLDPAKQAWLRASLRALHRGGLPEHLRMAVLAEALK